jgi:nicotinamide-nucleotide amidase
VLSLFLVMNAEIITIGDELLIGQVVDTNSAFLADALSHAGLDVSRITTVPDRRDDILSTLKEASQRARLILITGGLGPTKDDITKEALAVFFEDHLVQNNQVLEHIGHRMSERGIEMNPLNVKQAEVLSSCEVLHNELGTAPGMWMESNGRVYVSMPGVPHEMIRIFTEEALPRIKTHFGGDAIVHRVLLVTGVPESALSLQLESWEQALPPHIRLAYLPSLGMIRLRLTAHGKNEETLEGELDALVEAARPLLGRHLVGEHQGSLEELVGKMLTELNATLSLAESCSGGGLSRKITSVPGSSQYFKGGIIAYDNLFKVRMLRVGRQNLLRHGAVSAPVVEEMARGIRCRMKTDFSVATSGIAGPGGGTPEKPVGTVWIAVDSKWGTVSRCFRMFDGRERVMERTVTAALGMLLGEIARSTE